MPPKRMTANPVRPARYRPGKPVGPEPQESSGEEEDQDGAEEESADEKPSKPMKEPAAIVSSALKKVDLNKRFEQARKEEEARRAEEESSEEESEGDKKEEDDSEEEGSSEYSSEPESESEEEEVAPKPVLLRPKFIPKSKRNDNVVASVTAESAATALDEGNSKKKAEEVARRKEEAHALVEEHLRQQAEARETARKTAEDDHTNDASLIDDTDDLDPAAERAAWKLRELLRVKRERDELEKVEKEREEIERRRNMDEKERYKEDMEYARKKREEAKEARGEMKFMQKYYHKGAFYQDDSEILKRNYATAPVEDQAVNKEILPKYMQVRGEEYGKRGKTKWTHLAAEDTSKVEGGSPWFDKKFAGNTLGKIGGMKDERFLPDKAKGGRDDRIDFKRSRGDRWDANGRQPPEGPKAIFNHDRRRAQGCQGFDRHRPRRSRSRSRSRDRGRVRERDKGGDRYYPRNGDMRGGYRRDGVRGLGGYDDHDRDRDAGHRRNRSRDKEGDRKRRPVEKDESMDKRRRVEAP